MNTKTKSPLKEKPLRYPGQSLDEEIDKLLNEKFEPYAVAMLFAVGYAGMEWFRWYNHMPYSPMIYTIMAIIMICIFCIKLIKTKEKVKTLKLGRDGERIVGQSLESMRERGYKIFHDIQGENFNIDHVIICKNGIFTIETKTFSKPIQGKGKIKYDGKQIIINGKKSLSDILTQAKAEAYWLKNLFQEATGKTVAVKPVVAFPGWWVDNSAAGYNPDIWVVNSKVLVDFIPKSKINISETDMHLYADTLSRFIRNEN